MERLILTTLIMLLLFSFAGVVHAEPPPPEYDPFPDHYDLEIRSEWGEAPDPSPGAPIASGELHLYTGNQVGAVMQLTRGTQWEYVVEPVYTDMYSVLDCEIPDTWTYPEPGSQISELFTPIGSGQHVHQWMHCGGTSVNY